VGATFKRFEAMEDKSNAATMLNLPYSIRAKAAALKSMGSAVKAIGPYQATGGFVMRDWAKQNEDVLVNYLKAYVEAVRWSLDPANKQEAVRFLMQRLQLPENVATQAYEVATDPKEGMAKDSKLDMEGFRNVLKLRATHEGRGAPPAPEKYIDLSYYQKALAGL
jgi:ABC-type nitrate/sulfonate/bicarbonate transport system substrate-binding protein